MPSAALHALLNDLIDYAGLFPPAKLDMARSAEAFARHRAGPHAFGLARFILPVSKLDDFSACAAKHIVAVPDDDASAPPEPWRLSALVDGPVEETLEQVEAFNNEHGTPTTNSHKHAHNALVDTLEFKVQTPDTVDYALEQLPEELFPFFEIPLDADFRGFAACLAGTGGGAKIRTGGVTPDAFPTAEKIADFILAFHAADVPFKATAGLHHPVRGVYPLTYEPNSPKGTMHGFVNLFLAAALVHAQDLPRADVIALLNETSPDAFRFTDEGASWRNRTLATPQIATARENFAICFGSCSYDDPIDDLKKLGWL